MKNRIINEKLGELVYQEGKIEIRTHPQEKDSRIVYVSNQGFLFQQEEILNIAERTPINEIKGIIWGIDDSLSYFMRIESISPENLALVLARSRIVEKNYELADKGRDLIIANREISSLESRTCGR